MKAHGFLLSEAALRRIVDFCLGQRSFTSVVDYRRVTLVHLIVMSYHVMPSNVLSPQSSRVTPCWSCRSLHALSCFVGPCHVVSRRVTSRHVTSRPVPSRHVTSRHVTSRHVTSCHVMSCHVMSCRVMSCHVLSCPVLSCRVVSCRVVSCHVRVVSKSR